MFEKISIFDIFIIDYTIAHTKENDKYLFNHIKNLNEKIKIFIVNKNSNINSSIQYLIDNKIPVFSKNSIATTDLIREINYRINKDEVLNNSNY